MSYAFLSSDFCFRQMIEPVELASWLQGDSKAADFKRKTFYGMRGKRALRRGKFTGNKHPIWSASYRLICSDWCCGRVWRIAWVRKYAD